MEKNISKVPTLIEEEKSSEEKDIKVIDKQGKKKGREWLNFSLPFFPFTFNSPFNCMPDIFLTF